MTGSQLALYDTLANIIGNPAFLSQLSGLAALSENAWVSGNGTQANSGWNPANPVLRVGNFGHSCSPLMQLQ